MAEPRRMAASCSRKVRRPCIPCRVSKKGCNREIPACQSCCDRGQPGLCLYEERVPLFLGYDTTTPIQPEGLERQEIFFEAERTQDTERNDKTTDFQEEFCETGQAAYQSGQEFQSPSAYAASLNRNFQASNSQIEDWTNEGELVTSKRSSPRLVSRCSLTTGDPEERPSSSSPCTTQSYFDMALTVDSTVSLYISIHGSHYSRFPCHLGSNPKFQHLAFC
jgi:hypothetical protein